MFLVTFLSWRQKSDEQNGQEDGIDLAISTFWMEEMVLPGTQRNLIRSLWHPCGFKQEL